ncbi:RadC family protein [Alkalispirochaeta americana]|nr:DNA repair protein RadC [Alkalispirochaeta americana]
MEQVKNGCGPRERLLGEGAHVLSDQDLLAVVLGSGHQGCGVFALAQRVLGVLEESQFRATPQELMSVSGVGPAKATLLAAAVEFCRRVLAPRNYRIRHPSDAVPLLQHYADRRQEHFLAISLNGAHEVNAVRIVSVGLVNRTLVHPREVFADALQDRAAAIIVAHNHPSGNTDPSAEDRAVTRTLTEAGDILGIRLLDHIVFSSQGYYSFRENDEL